MAYNNFQNMNYFWCRKVLPLVFDESISYYEQLCKLVNRMNELTENNNELNEIVKDAIEQINSIIYEFNSLKDIVDTTVRFNSLFLTSIDKNGGYPTISFINDGVPNRRISSTTAVYYVNYNVTHASGISGANVDAPGVYYISIPLYKWTSDEFPRNQIMTTTVNPNIDGTQYISIISINAINSNNNIVFVPDSVVNMFEDDSKLYGYYDYLVRDFIDLNKRVNSLSDTVNSNTIRISNNERDIRLINQDIDNIDLRVANNTARISQSENAISNMEAHLSSIDNSISSIGQVVTSNTDDIANLSNRLDDTDNKAEAAIGRSNEAIEKANEALNNPLTSLLAMNSAAASVPVCTKLIRQPAITIIPDTNNERLMLGNAEYSINHIDKIGPSTGGITPENGSGTYYISYPLIIPDNSPPANPIVGRIRNPKIDTNPFITLAAINSNDGSTWDISSLLYFFEVGGN